MSSLSAIAPQNELVTKVSPKNSDSQSQVSNKSYISAIMLDLHKSKQTIGQKKQPKATKKISEKISVRSTVPSDTSFSPYR